MPSVEQVITMCRQRLGYPLHSALTTQQILQFIWDTNQFYVNEMKLTDEGWLVKTIPLAISASADEYPIAAGDFMPPFLITTDRTLYSDGREREVDVIRLQDRDLAGFSDVPAIDAGPSDVDTVQGIGFYGNGTQWVARAYPSGSAGNYTLFYEPGLVAQQGLDGNPQMLKMYHALLSISVALQCVGLCEWKGLDYGQTVQKRAELRVDLAKAESDWKRQFGIYIRTSADQSTGFRQPFASDEGIWDMYRS